MKYVLIRDDDVNYHTDFGRLQQVYGFLFDHEIPINLSVIPSVNAAATTRDAESGMDVYEPFLPAHIAGTQKLFPICDNGILIERLLEIKRIEFLMHGLEHSGIEGKYEFETGHLELLKAKLNQGIAICRTAFGRSPDTFVAPQDKYSSNAVRLLREKFRTFSLGWVDKTRVPKSYLPAYYWMKIRSRNYLKQGKFLLTEHPGCLYSRSRAREECDSILEAYLATHEFTVILTHHMDFFQGDQLNETLWNAFYERITRLNKAPSIQFITFSELYDIL